MDDGKKIIFLQTHRCRRKSVDRVILAVAVVLQEWVPFEPDDLQGGDVAKRRRKFLEFVVLKQNRLKRDRNSRL